MNYPHEYRDAPLPFELIEFDIRREGRSWHGEEFRDSYDAMPEKMEAIGGKLSWDDDQRLKDLGALLENLGIDRAVRLGDPKLWKAAVAELPDA